MSAKMAAGSWRPGTSTSFPKGASGRGEIPVEHPAAVAVERQRGRAEAAFRREASDIPVGAAAAGTMVDLVLAVDRMVAARRRIVPESLAVLCDDAVQHLSHLSEPDVPLTS